MTMIRSVASWTLLGILLMPSPRILDPERTHKRHATCEHHLRRHHPDPEDRARILRKAERRRRRMEEEQARIDAGRERLERARAAVVAAQATADSQDDAEAALLLAQALDESNLQPCQAAADPQDDDGNMKRGRRLPRVKTLFWSLQEPPRIRPAGEFLAMLRAHVETDRQRVIDRAESLSHYGSGPCHSIPRPREGTIPPCPLLPGVTA